MEIQTELPKIDMSDNETGCCPRFHPEDWDDKAFRFDQETFAKAASLSFLHMPVNLGKVMSDSMAKIEAAGGMDPDRYLILSNDKSNWKTEHYFKVTQDIPGMEMVKLSGTFMTKAYDGKFQDIPTFIQQFKADVNQVGRLVKDVFIFYTTCPKCARHYGHNYMVLFGKVD